MANIHNCNRCGEDALLVHIGWNQYAVRVRRSTGCKWYRPRRYDLTCRTEVRVTAEQAVAEWNGRFGRTEETR